MSRRGHCAVTILLYTFNTFSESGLINIYRSIIIHTFLTILVFLAVELLQFVSNTATSLTQPMNIYNMTVISWAEFYQVLLGESEMILIILDDWWFPYEKIAELFIQKFSNRGKIW